MNSIILNNKEEEFLKIEIDAAWNGQEAVELYEKNLLK